MAIDPLDEKPRIAFDYIKGNGFSTYHSDGAVGGVTPRGDIHLTFYSERMAIPRRVTQALNADGTLGEVIDVESRNSVVREMDVNIVMTLRTAVELHQWLSERISEVRANGGKDERSAEI